MKKIKIYIIFDLWLENEKNNVKHKTYLYYQRAITQIKTVLKNKYIDKIREIDCQNCIYNLYNKNNYSKSTLKGNRVVLHRTFKYAKKMGLIDYNPASDLDIPKNAKERKIEALTSSEQTLLESVCLKDKYGLLIIFFLQTGLRSQEFRNLRWKDYNTDNETLSIKQSKTVNGVRVLPLTRTCQETRLLESGATMKAICDLLGHSNEHFTSKRYVHSNIEYLRSQIELLN